MQERDNYRKLQIDALCIIRALIGVISDNFRMVSISRHAERIDVQIILSTYCDEDTEEIEDLKTEFEALYPGPIDYEMQTIISQEPIILERPNASTIIVFKRRECLQNG